MKYLAIVTVALALGTGSLGCIVAENELPEDYQSAIPQAEDFQLNVPDEGIETAERALMALKADGEVKAQFYMQTVGTVRELNGWTWAMLHFVDDITSHPFTSEIHGGYEWGPFTPALSLVTLRFQLTKEGENHFAFVLQFQPKGSEDDVWSDVLSGDYRPESGAIKSRGSLMWDFAAARALDPTVDADGQLGIEYDSTTGVRYVDMTFVNFKDKHMDEPANATYTYDEKPDQSGTFQFTAFGDVHQDDPENAHLTAKEEYSIRARWLSGGSGRADVMVTGGDLETATPPFDGYSVSECWDDYFNQVYFIEIAYPSGMDPWSGDPVGDLAACVFDTPEFAE